MLAAADFNKGLKAYQSGDFEIALAEWLPLAEQGNAKAQFNLGLMYQSGKGVKQNDKTAFRWLKLAGKQELVHAQFIVGVMYQLGIGAPISDELAATWYERAAIKGDAKAQYNLVLVSHRTMNDHSCYMACLHSRVLPMRNII